MRHLLSVAVNPTMSLTQYLSDWPTIARALREPPRTRSRQLDALFPNRVWLS